MKIAVTYDNGEIFQHFGHTEFFKLYEVEGENVVSSEVIPTLGSGHGALAGLLSVKQVQVLICGGIGAGARTALDNAGIELYPGASGNADKAVSDYICGKLVYNPDTACSNHEHDHENGHKCSGNCKSSEHNCCH